MNENENESAAAVVVVASVPRLSVCAQRMGQLYL